MYKLDIRHENTVSEKDKSVFNVRNDNGKLTVQKIIADFETEQETIPEKFKLYYGGAARRSKFETVRHKTSHNCAQPQVGGATVET